MRVPSPHHRLRPRLAGAALLATGALVFAGCSAPTQEEADASAVDVTGWVTTTPAATGSLDQVDWNAAPEPDILDPALSDNYGQNEILSNVCQSLQTFDTDSQVVAGLATATPSEDHLTIVYDIDPAAVFSDGTPVTAEDAVFSLERMRDADYSIGSYWTGYYTHVADIAATGERQVTVTMTQPDLLFEQVMATTAGTVVQKAAAEAAGSSFGTASGLPVCSGPYRFVSWNQGSDLTMVANENYWGDQPALSPTFVFHFLMGDATQSTALSSGELQGMYTAPPAALPTLQQAGSVYLGASSTTMSVTPTEKDGPLQDPDIRTALFLALDRAALASSAFSGAAVAAQAVASPWTYGDIEHTVAPGTGGTDDELAQAKKLVEDSGYAGEEIVIAAYTGISEAANTSVQALVEAGQSIGLNMVFDSITLADMYELFIGGDGWKTTNADGFPTQNYAVVADPMAVYSNWAEGSPLNYGGFDDPTFQDLYAQASATIDPQQRADLITQLDEVAFAQLPWIPLVNVANVLYLAPGVTGAPPSFTSNFYTPWAAQVGAAG